MATRRTTSKSAPQEPTALVLSRESFAAQLEERIELGDAILKSGKSSVDLSRIFQEYEAWHDYNMEFIKQAFNNPRNEYLLEYDDMGEYRGPRVVSMYGESKSLETVYQESIAVVFAKLTYLKRLKERAPLLKTLVDTPVQKRSLSPSPGKTEVFVVHGRDEAVKQEVARFVEKLGLKPIILHEQPSGGRTIIEKIEAYTNVGFAIILYTPCDVGGLKEENLTLRDRARQNVVFEHGFLIGKIGRKNVCALVKGDVETPNDISGVVFIPMDRHWKIDLVKELKSSEYDVDLNKALD